jgi:glycosyltransferase involved in cell wall biosynthesis
MKTLLLCPELFLSQGGITRILRLYLKALCELAGPDDSVDLVVLNDPVFDSGDRRRYAAEHLGSWEVCGGDKSRFVRKALRLGRKADRIVCGHVSQLPVAWLAARTRLRWPPYYLIAHGIEVWRPFTLLERRALRGARGVWCVSEFTRRELLQRCPLESGRARVLPNGLDPYFDAPATAERPPAGAAAAAAATEPAETLCVSRLDRDDRYKGIDHLIAALPAVRARVPTATLRIIGTGSDRPRLQRLTSDLGLNGSVTFAGVASDAALREEYGRCRAFALPSEREGFGLVYLEAMAGGKPCLAAQAGGAPEVVDATCGRLVPYGDVAAIAAGWADLLTAEWDAAAIRERTRERFGFEAFRRRLGEALSA